MNRAERYIIAEQIDAERERQERLKANGKFKYTLADREMSYMVALACLGEEFGEISKAVLNVAGYSHDALPEEETSWQRNLENELLQLAACCVAWLERFGPPETDVPKVTETFTRCQCGKTYAECLTSHCDMGD